MSHPSFIVLSSLIGDALSLSAHWIYSQREIAEKFGRITGYATPATSYHPGKQAGDFTHYGDQTMILLRSLAKHGCFDLLAFAAEWRAFWESPTTLSYRDGATKATLLNLQQGLPPEKAASLSNDIAGASRIALLFLLKWASSEDLIAAARAQTAFTHDDLSVIETAEFFARVTLAVQAGSAIADALRETASLKHWKAIPPEWFAAAAASHESSEADSTAAKAHGLTCHVPDAFPVICHLLLRHPTDAATSLTANVEAGGDSAARGLMMGMIYGAQSNAAALPAEWISGLQAHAEILQLTDQLTSHA